MAEAGGSSTRPKSARLDFTKMINVQVGTAKRAFTIHQDIVCGRSKFFKAACSPKWARGSKNITMPEDDPDSFQVYLHCLYEHKVDVGDPSVILEGEAADWHDRTRKWERLLKAYALADKLGDIIAANMIVDETVDYSDRTHRLPHDSCIKLAFKITPEESPMQRLLVDGYVHETNARSIQKLCNDGITPTAFLHRVLVEKARLEEQHRDNKVSDVFQRDFLADHKCRYHQHDEEHPRCGDDCEKQEQADKEEQTDDEEETDEDEETDGED